MSEGVVVMSGDQGIAGKIEELKDKGWMPSHEARAGESR